GVGQPLGLVLLGVGLLADGGVELQLAAVDLLAGDRDVLHLHLHLAGLLGLGAGDVDLFLDGSLLEGEALFGVGDLGVHRVALLLFLLAGGLLLDLGLAVGHGGGDAGVLERLLDLGLAERVEVALGVLDL